MRGLAILPIVAGHCYNALRWPPGSFSAHLTAVWTDLNTFFIFISGYLFQHLLARFAYPAYLKGKFRNVIVPYLIVSVPAVLVYATNWKSHPHFPQLIGSLPLWQKVPLLILTGAHMGPYWFKPMMAVFYTMAPALVAMDKHPRSYIAIAPLLLVSVLLVPRPTYDLQPLQAAVHYLPVYLLGMCVSHFHDRIIPLLTRWWAAMVALSIAFLGVIIYGSYAALTFDRLPLTAFMCLTLLALMSRFTPERVPALDLLARYAFGIFFMHAYYVAALRQALTKWPELGEGSQLSFLVILVGVMTLSMMTVALVRRLFPAKSRLLIGS
ncbi:acyltransferase family protein [Novosphingobium sp. M1R2S20]|uniref:Acyltransferase family protein n=1 Tax=Novosphingobium rhizovicinum TaxID=3228928 RepID=A0ABV3R7U7_9SPHN